MRVFVLALAVFLATAGCIGWGSWYVSHLCDRLVGVLEDMAALPLGEIDAFAAVYGRYEQIWQRSEIWLHLLDGHKGADVIEDLFTELGLRYLGGDGVGVSVVQEKLALQLDKLREGERITVDDIF